MDDSQNAEQIQKKEAYLISLDKSKNIKYFGKCKILVDLPKELITITLKDEASTQRLLYFDLKFINKENLICAINKKTNRNMVIFYPKKESCIKVFNAVIKIQQRKSLFQAMDAVDEENLFKTAFFVPILKEIQKNVAGNIELKTMLYDLVNSLAEEEKKIYLNLIAEATLGSIGHTVNNDITKSANVENIDYFEISDDESVHESKKIDLLDETAINELDDNVRESDEELTDFEGKHDFFNDLDSEEENKQNMAALTDISNADVERNCDEQNTKYNLRKRSFLNSSFNITFGDADIKDSEDDLYNETEEDSDQDDENFELKRQKISSHSQHFDLSNYEFVEYSENGLLKKKLLVFTSAGKSHCYAYAYDCSSNYYKCCKCSNKKNHVTVKILTRIDGSIKLETGNNDHICQPIQYFPDDYKSRKTVQLPDFEVAERKWRGKTYPKLTVFDSKNRNLCREYSWSSKLQYFYCPQCTKKHGRHVCAKLIKDKNGDYIELGRALHECELKQYQVTQELTFKTVQKPNFKIETFIKANGKEKTCLTISDPIDKNLVYKYFYNTFAKKFVCASCNSKRKHVSAKLCEVENGNDYIELSNSEHVCQPKAAQSHFESTRIFKPNFEVKTETTANGDEKRILNIFNSKDGTIRRRYFYHKQIARDVCSKCYMKKKCVRANLCQNKKEEEYVELLNENDHVCCAQYTSTSKTIQHPNFKNEEESMNTTA